MIFVFFFQFQWFWASIHMDACADESLYHFTATVSHRNLNKTVHLWDRIGQGSSGGGGGILKKFLYVKVLPQGPTPYPF